ncbi:MAG: 3'-5' exonuclease [Proteobacteria bacterium]|nr:3'-5' exonuclease [Pseudomonadota bacterium]
MNPVLAFDIETVPDVDGLRRLWDLPDTLDDSEVAEMAFQKRRAQAGHDFLPPYLHRVLVISYVMRNDAGVQVFTIGAPECDEAATIGRFHRALEKHEPQLVSWNGGGFDLPVLNYRGLVHGIEAPRFWEPGRNTYTNRYHDLHLDLMDVLAMFQPRNNAPLDDVARLAGLPGKIGVGGAGVWDSWRRGEIAAIRDYCEADTVNTYLLWLRFQKLRGALTADRHDEEAALLRAHLAGLPGAHWLEFLARWNAPQG